MKKSFLSICLATTAALALNATDYTGTIYITRNGQTTTETATVSVLEQDNNLNTLVLQVPFMGTDLVLNMSDVPGASADGITTYSAERNVPTGTFFGSMNASVFARVTDGFMAANVAIPDYGVTMWFNTVGDHFQLPNSDFETWTATTGEPDRWHGFMTAYGNATLVSTSQNLVKLNKSEDIHAGTNGTYSAVMTSGATFGIVANGTMTNGRLKAGSMFATSTDNHAEMDKSSTATDANGDPFYMPLYAKPDKFNVWLKYTQGSTNANNKASVSVKTFDGTYYQEPVDKEYTNLSGSIVGGQIPAGGWTQYSFPFDYDSYAANGWDPAVTTYNMEMAAEPSLDDFTATIEGVSAVVTKTMEQNQDGTYRIAISVVAADLQTASCYIINVSVPQGLIGDVDDSGKVEISDVTALIDYLLNGSGVSINSHNADVDYSGKVEISDVTILIDLLLSGN